MKNEKQLLINLSKLKKIIKKYDQYSGFESDDEIDDIKKYHKFLVSCAKEFKIGYAPFEEIRVFLDLLIMGSMSLDPEDCGANGLITLYYLQDLMKMGLVDKDGEYLYILSHKFLNNYTLDNKVTTETKQLSENITKCKYMTYANKIKKVDLVFNNKINEEIERVRNVLKNIDLVQDRMKEIYQHTGLCFSFYGESGTGKTETVMQLSRELGIDIYYYNVADSESGLCGEQQEAINKMFEEYNDICNEYKKLNKHIPILLLNEADALFNKRTSKSGTTAERENNKLQAELLNHIDKFDGIIIITTNVFDFFDKAFERRFLFKINFEKPDETTQKKIWKNNFNKLEDEHISKLVKKYNFTGANISNIKKKTEINYIIYGNEYSHNDIETFSKEEKNEKDELTKKIGFCS